MEKAKKNSGLTTTIGKFLDNLSYLKIGGFLLAVILISALYFFIATPYGFGVDKKTDFEFGDALYFSIVTFATVGYGDYLPIHFGKVVASIEIISGILFTAIFVGKIASARDSQDYYYFYILVRIKED